MMNSVVIKRRSPGCCTPLTVDGHQHRGASAALVLHHGLVDVGQHRQRVARHPLAVPDQDGVGG